MQKCPLKPANVEVKRPVGQWSSSIAVIKDHILKMLPYLGAFSKGKWAQTGMAVLAVSYFDFFMRLSAVKKTKMHKSLCRCTMSKTIIYQILLLLHHTVRPLQ